MNNFIPHPSSLTALSLPKGFRLLLLAFAPALTAGDAYDALVREAYGHSPELKGAHASWEAAVERGPQLTALPDPTVTWGYFVQRMETRQQFRVEQMFPGWGQRRLQGAVADEAVLVAEQTLEVVAAGVRQQTLAAASAHAELIESIEVVRAHLDELQSLLAVTERRYESGAVSRADVLRLENEIDRQRTEVESLEARLPSSRARIQSVVGREVDDLLEGIVQIPEARELPELSPEIMAALRRRNPELLQAAAEVRQAERERERAAASSRPSVMLGVEYMQNRASAPDEVMAMVGVSIPLWQGKYRAERREALARLRERQFREEAVGQTLIGQAHGVYFAWEDARRRETLIREVLIPRTNETLELVESDYRVGRAGFLDLIETRRALLDLELESIRMRGAVFAQALDWERMAGVAVEGGRMSWEGGRMRGEG